MKNSKLYFGISFIGVEFLSLAFWVMFIFCFLFALGTDGPVGDFLPMAISLVKNHPVLAVISILLALHLISKVDKL